MTTITYILAFGACGGLCLVALWSAIRMSRRRSDQIRRVKSTMHGRPAFTHEKFGERFFVADDAPVAARVRAILEEAVGVDLSRAVPEDRLVEDLGLGGVDGLAGIHLMHDLQGEFQIKPDGSPSTIVTLRELVEVMAAGLGKAEAG